MRMTRSPLQSSSNSVYAERIPDVSGDASSLRSEQLGKTPKVNHFLLPSLFLEVAILACLAVFAYYLRFTTYFKVFRRYHECNATYLTYPYYKGSSDGSQIQDDALVYVNDVDLYCISNLLPPALVLVGELLRFFCSSAPQKTIATISPKFRISLIVRRLFRFIGIFWMGSLLTSILTDAIKLLTGSGRPYLFTLNPPVTRVGDQWCQIDDTDDSTIRNAQLSFPSFYATLAAYAATFSIFYVNVIYNVHGNYFLRPVLSAMLSGMALLAAYTRWMLYTNHWQDLVAGLFLGSAIAIYLSAVVLNGFQEHRPDPATSAYPVSEARAGFLGLSWLPRVTAAGPSKHRHYTQTTSSGGGTTSNGNPSEFHTQPNAFQQEINRRVEDHGRRYVNTLPSSPNQEFY